MKERKELGSESQDFLGEDIVDGVDDEMDLISDGPEEEADVPVPLDSYSEAVPGATIPGIRIDREKEEEEEQ